MLTMFFTWLTIGGGGPFDAPGEPTFVVTLPLLAGAPARGAALETGEIPIELR